VLPTSGYRRNSKPVAIGRAVVATAQVLYRVRLTARQPQVIQLDAGTRLRTNCISQRLISSALIATRKSGNHQADHV